MQRHPRFTVTLVALTSALALPAVAQTSNNVPASAPLDSPAPRPATPPERMAPPVAATAPLAGSRPATTMPSTPGRADQMAAAPAAGANSFTEGQVKGRLEDAGYRNVRGLSKDAQGTWHAQAERGGQPVGVTVDYQGNVTPAR